MKGVAIVSGGMDSVTLAHMLADMGDELHLVSFNYGQRHVKELAFANQCAADLGFQISIVDLSTITPLLKGSALTDSTIEVPHGHYAEDSMRLTVVPNRNAIMLAIATGIAVANESDYVATGVHAGDHAVYPDCRPEFVNIMSEAMVVANESFVEPWFEIRAPFVEIAKQDIVSIGSQLRTPVDYSMTWSCYEGNELHCGSCGTCVERKEAFSIAGVLDPTEYSNV